MCACCCKPAGERNRCCCWQSWSSGVISKKGNYKLDYFMIKQNRVKVSRWNWGKMWQIWQKRKKEKLLQILVLEAPSLKVNRIYNQFKNKDRKLYSFTLQTIFSLFLNLLYDLTLNRLIWSVKRNKSRLVIWYIWRIRKKESFPPPQPHEKCRNFFSNKKVNYLMKN